MERSIQQQKEVPLLFYAYANVEEDKLLLKTLENHLGTLIRKKVISEWHKGKIDAGTEWAKQIEYYLDKAAIILLLISPDFLASDYRTGIEEVTHAMKRHEQGEARVIPILLRPVAWQETPFAKLQPLPSNGKFVTEWANQDAAFLEITHGIRRVIEDITAPMAPAVGESSRVMQGNTEQTPFTQQPGPNTLSRRKLLLYTGLAGIAGIALGAAGFGGITILTKPASLTDVRVIMTPSSFSGGLSNTELPLLRDALHAVLGLPVSIPTVGESYMDSINRFGSGEFNVFWASDYAYVIAKAKYDALPILPLPILRRKNLTPDDPYYYSYILTTTSSNISRLTDLKGKRLSYVDPQSTSGYLFPRYGMHQTGLNDHDVQTNYAQSHRNSLESIFNGKADACAVSSEFYKSKDGVYKSPDYTEFLQEYHVSDNSIIPIYRSEPLFTPPVVVHSDISEDDERRLQNGFLFLQDPTLLGQLGIAGFGSVVDEEYNPIRRAAQTLDIDLQNPNP